MALGVGEPPETRAGERCPRHQPGVGDDLAAYSQSKLALTMWSRAMALEWQKEGLQVVTVNPGSLLASKMVREGFGMPGKDINFGVNILRHLALDPDAIRPGEYYDSDEGAYGPPHKDALDPAKAARLIDVMRGLVA